MTARWRVWKSAGVWWTESRGPLTKGARTFDTHSDAVAYAHEQARTAYQRERTSWLTTLIEPCS